MKPNGIILHEDTDRVVIATGLRAKSQNVKTGAMIQVWILNRRENPIDAVRNGHDATICMDCPLRAPSLGQRQCYVDVSKAPRAIWLAYSRGRYPRIMSLYAPMTDWLELFRGRVVRFGAYGEPVLIPFKLVKAIVSVATSHTGYTHQWRNPAFAAYREYLMASTHAGDYQIAQASGWRTFTVSHGHLAGQIQCPASKERGHKLTCAECTLCDGAQSAKRSVQIQPHGPKAKSINL